MKCLKKRNHTRAKCWSCKDGLAISNLHRHFRQYHIATYMKSYIFRCLQILTAFLREEAFLSRSFDSKKYAIMIIRTNVTHFKCQEKKCSTQVMVKCVCHHFQLFYYGSHNHPLPRKNEPTIIESPSQSAYLLYSTLYENCKILAHSDSKIIKKQVMELLNKNNNTDENLGPLLLYKPHHGVIQKSILDLNENYIDEIKRTNDLFLLGFKTNSKLNSSITKSIIGYSVDLCSKTNVYNIPLITVQALTGFGRAYPIQYFFASEINEKIFAYLLEYIKPLLSTTPKILTNYEMNIINKLKNNLDNVTIWGCLLELQHNVWIKFQEIDNVHIIKELYSVIIEYILLSDNKNKFERHYAQLKVYWQLYYPKIIGYLDENLTTDSKNWLISNRMVQDFPIDSNKYACNIKDILKSKYRNQPISKLSDLIPFLLSFDNKYTSLLVQNELYDFKDANHISATEIISPNIREICANIYEMSENSFKFKIYKKNENCRYGKYCLDKCNLDKCVNLCCHMYVCSCDDASCFCPHIHKLHSELFIKKIE